MSDRINFCNFTRIICQEPSALFVKVKSRVLGSEFAMQKTPIFQDFNSLLRIGCDTRWCDVVSPSINVKMHGFFISTVLHHMTMDIFWVFDGLDHASFTLHRVLRATCKQLLFDCVEMRLISARVHCQCICQHSCIYLICLSALLSLPVAWSGWPLYFSDLNVWQFVNFLWMTLETFDAPPTFNITDNSVYDWLLLLGL